MFCRLLVLLCCTLGVAWADVSLPPRMLAPLSTAEAWNVINLARGNVDRLIAEDRPLEVPPQVSIISPSLRVLAKSPVKSGFEAAVEQSASEALKQVNQIAKEAMAENGGALRGLFGAMEKQLDTMALGFDPEVTSGEIYHCWEHTDEVQTAAGMSCPRCNRWLEARRVPYSFIFGRPAKPNVTLAVVHSAGRLTLKLRYSDGKPVLSDRLWPMHGLVVQAFAIGPGYERLKLEPAKGVGDYECDFDPEKSGKWTIVAGVTPAITGLPEFPSGQLHLGQSSTVRHSPEAEVRVAEVGGFRFQLSVTGSKGARLRVRQLQGLQLMVTEVGGLPVQRLEPLEQAFAHIDAIYDASPTVLQLHPAGGDILRDDVRGGPGLSFRVFSPEVGWLLLFARVRIDGQTLAIPFCLKVEP